MDNLWITYTILLDRVFFFEFHSFRSCAAMARAPCRAHVGPLRLAPCNGPEVSREAGAEKTRNEDKKKPFRVSTEGSQAHAMSFREG